MDAIPEGWPLEPQADERRTVPLFPLPNVFLFPGCILPLQVFEPRYRQMVGDLLDSQGRLVIGTVQEEHREELSGTAPVLPIAGLGEIGRHERLSDGRYLVWLIGLARARIREVGSDRLYRKVELEILHEPTADADDELRPLLKKAILRRAEKSDEQKRELSRRLSQDLPIGYMADLLLQSMQLPQSVMEDLFTEIAPDLRAQAALAEHAKRPI